MSDLRNTCVDNLCSVLIYKGKKCHLYNVKVRIGGGR